MSIVWEVWGRVANLDLTRKNEHKNPRRHFLCLVTLTFDPQNKWVSGIMVDHVYVKFGDPSCIDFWDIVRKKADKQRWKHYPHDYRMAKA